MRWNRRGAVLIALLGLAPACAREKPKPAPDLSYLPAETIVVAQVDTVRLRQAPLYRDLTAKSGDEPGRWHEVKEFLNHLGVNPERDLDSALFAYRGTDPETGEWVVLLRGRFDAERIQKGLQEPDARMSETSYRKWTISNLVRVPEVGDLSLVVMDPSALVLGKSDALRKVLDVRDGAAPSLATNEEIRQLIAGVNPKAQVWAVMDSREISRLMREQSPEAPRNPAAKGLASMQAGRFWAAFSDGLDLALDFDSDSEKNARNVSDALRGILAFGKMGSGGQDPDAARLIDAIQVESDRRSTRVRLSLDGEIIKRLETKFGQARQTPFGPPEPR